MQNTVRYKHKNRNKLSFDLKGSTFSRKVKFKGGLHCSKTLKDLNFVELNKHHSIMDLPLEDYRLLLKTIEDDSIFLREHGLMDYSLMVVME